MGEDFDPWVQSAFDLEVSRGVGAGLYFNPWGEPYPTRKLNYSLFCAKIIKIQ
jgi:hypothetical protein